MKMLAIFLLSIAVPLASCSISVGLIGPSAHGIVIQGPGSKTALNGPDGSHISAVAAGGTVVAPPVHGGAVAAAVAPALTAAVAPAVGVVPVGAAIGVVDGGLGHLGSGLEGQYIHDNTEALYDDGSYRGEH